MKMLVAVVVFLSAVAGILALVYQVYSGRVRENDAKITLEQSITKLAAYNAEIQTYCSEAETPTILNCLGKIESLDVEYKQAKELLDSQKGTLLASEFDKFSSLTLLIEETIIDKKACLSGRLLTYVPANICF